MLTALKSAVAGAYAACGGLRRLHDGRLVVLTFHRVRRDGERDAARPMRNLEVGVSDFRWILSWMRERYRPVALGDWMVGGSAPERASFAVTFDDGWADNYEHAYAVLRDMQIPATIFLSTGAVEDRTPFWWQAPGLTDAEIERLKTRPPGELESMAAALPQSNDFLTWDQAKEMGRSGLVSFGPHGHRHALLTELSREEALADVARCWSLLRARVPGALLPALAWPNGNARTDMGADLEAMGIRAALGTWRGAVFAVGEGRWNLPRNNVDANVASCRGLLPWLLLRARRGGA